MPKFGLIGNPISKSLSPALFKSGYNGKYPYDLIEGKVFEKSWSKFLQDYDGINITAPFKEDTFNQALGLTKDGLGTISGPCYKTKSANIAVKTKEGIEFHNSDFTGVILSIAEHYFPGIVYQCYKEFGEKAYIKVHQFIRQNIQSLFSEQPQALIIGCGGAGRTAAIAAAEMGFSTAIMNRTISKAHEFAAGLPEYGFLAVPISDFIGAVQECNLIIYTVPVSIEDIKELRKEHLTGEIGGHKKVILEANYTNPAFSGDTLKYIEDAGCDYITGKQWLLYQALTGYSLLTGQLPDIDKMTSLMK